MILPLRPDPSEVPATPRIQLLSLHSAFMASMAAVALCMHVHRNSWLSTDIPPVLAPQGGPVAACKDPDGCKLDSENW
jgi:hypothetical protein